MALIPDELYRDFVERRIDEIITAIGQIQPSGGTVVPITITTNGTYHAEDYNADGFEPVVVNVPRYGIKIIPIDYDFYELAT